VDYRDVQGILRFGYGRMTEASYALLRVRHVESARAWLRSAPITSAIVMQPPPSAAMQVAFTAAGLQALEVPPRVLKAFSPEFLGGMTEDSRSRRLGDVGSNAPSRWEWGGPSTVPHLLVMFFAKAGGLTTFVERVTGELWNDAFEVLRVLPTGNLDGFEPFGFADGISQPDIDWSQQRAVSKSMVEYSHGVALGEMLLGYRNEYNKYTDRPLLDAEPSSEGLLPAQDAPDKKDLGRNGTYLVMRQLRQDVRGFWQFIGREAGGDPTEADKLAALFVGRTREGHPLVLAAGEHATDRLNEFTFDHDPNGVRCPFGAHVRRANPRNADFAGHPTLVGRLLAALGFGPKEFRDDLMSSVRFHRIVRRGREYGPGLSSSDALQPAPPNDPERGLHFICLNANIGRQFEFLQNAWMMSTKFSAMTGESDPLIGNREPIPGCSVTDGFIVPRDGGLSRRVSGLPQFVTVRGGAYFFLPSLRAIQYFARA
jgi:deferrochelatase/peroxidase EfeB